MADGIATSKLADVVAKWWLMLMPPVADGIATCFLYKADVIAIVVDGIATWLEYVKADLIALATDGTSHWVSLS